jgi:hypothetical protein
MEVILAAFVNESNLKDLMLRLNHYIQEVVFFISINTAAVMAASHKAACYGN